MLRAPLGLRCVRGSPGSPQVIAFLALATQTTMPAPQVKDIYDKIKAAGKVLPTLHR
jgi:hypothetical protein